MVHDDANREQRTLQLTEAIKREPVSTPRRSNYRTATLSAQGRGSSGASYDAEPRHVASGPFAQDRARG